MAVQEQVFRDQLLLAVELNRGCVIHCVGAHGKLLDILGQQLRANALPPVVILHSYSGPATLVDAFLALERKAHDAKFKIFFSLNAKQLANASGSKQLFDPSGKHSKSEAACAKIPLDALLLETDAPDQAPSREASSAFQSELLDKHGLNEPALVQLALQGAAAIRNMPVDTLAAALYENACQAFGLKEEEQA
jgi:TatD DNase family protein